MGLGWAWARVHGEGADEKRRVWKLPVLFVDPLPASVDFDSMSTTLGTCTRTGSAQNGTLNRSVGSLAAGASATATIIVTPATAGMLNDTATVTAAGYER